MHSNALLGSDTKLYLWWVFEFTGFLAFVTVILREFKTWSTDTKSHIWANFDKILVTFLLLFSFWLLTHNLKYYLSVDSVINETWGVVTYFLGLLSGLITGIKTAVRGADGGRPGDTTTTAVSFVNDGPSTTDKTEARPLGAVFQTTSPEETKGDK